MHQRTDSAGSTSRPALTIRVASRKEVSGLTQWQSAFAQERKDHRYYELLEDTLKDGFTYGYLIVEDDRAVRAVQPYFLVDQDLLAGMSGALTKIVAVLRRLSERFMRARTLMVGCAAGEGHLDGDEAGNFATAEALGRSLPDVARELRCAMIVLKEFPAKYRAPLQCLLHEGFARVPSMPMTTLDIDYKNFEDYLSNCLSPRTRGKVRRKLRAAERAQPTITMSVVGDVTPFIEDVYPLYEKVFERSPLQFEKLTKEFLCEIGRRMPDKVRFFIWRQENRIIAFGLCTTQGNSICHEYVGFDYAVAFELNLYYRVFHDIIEWAIANLYKCFYSGSLNYDPKWHLRQSLYPVDLYVRHTSRPLNEVLRRVLPLMEPTRSDPILPNFHNYRELWD
ncbi:MAG TPA: GNAT family N-acetyltransferase [Pseudolabrys sp.]|jgi:Peptidogalycan biosysnthesis/recognition